MLSESKSEGARSQVRERVRIPEAVAKEKRVGKDRPRSIVPVFPLQDRKQG